MRRPDGTAAGQATAMLRPEAIAIIDSEGADLCGTVETVSFIGDRQRLTITGAADRPIVVEAPNSLAVEAGQRVGLGIEPCTVRLLPEDRR
jgi:putative spermidine/putrescine transport system ATP-binding protein